MFKKYIFKIIVSILTSFIYIKRFFVFIFKKSISPLKKLGLFLFSTILIHIYKIYIFFYKIIYKFLAPLKNWALAPLGSSFVIYIFIGVMVFGVLFENINAQETRFDETSAQLQNNLLFKLTSDIDSELIEEKGFETKITPHIFTYFNDSETKPYLSRQDSINALLKNDIDPIDISNTDTLIKPTIASTKTNLKLREKIETYTILSGDTLGGIAQKFGLNVQTLLWANNLTVRSYLKLGQQIIIPPINGIIYKVEKNDTLASISKKYKTETTTIKEFNKLIDSTLQVGQEIILPNAEKPAPIIKKIPTPTRTKPIPTKNIAISTNPTFAPYESTSDLLWPTDMRVITQYYSWRHTGLDIDGTYNTQNYASEDGTVIVATGGWNGGYGLYVIIDHGGGLQTLYAHNSKLFVSVGDYVKRGQVIGMVGSTGRSTGTHIHYEVRVNGQRVNPLRYIK